MKSRIPALGAALLLTAALAGCSGGATPAASSTTPASPSATPTPTPTPTPEPIALTCESIVIAETVGAFTVAGWTGQEREDGVWTVGGHELSDGIVCQWMLDHSVGTDNFSWFGWSPIDDVQAAEVIASLTENGEFLVDETPDGTYVTIDPNFAVVVDQDGYGMTYLVADGWIAGAATRSELQHVRVPEGWTPSDS